MSKNQAIDRVRKMYNEAFSEHSQGIDEYHEDNFYILSKDGRSVYKNCFLNFDKPVAFLVADESQDVVLIRLLTTDESYRNRGAARILLKNLISALKREFTLTVRESNIPAIKLYESFGFRVKEVVPNAYSFTSKDETGLVMELDNRQGETW